MTITTRNNRRIDFAILGGTLAVFFAFALGVIVEFNLLNTFKAIVHA
jgi:hypothetical protein